MGSVQGGNNEMNLEDTQASVQAGQMTEKGQVRQRQ